MNRAIPLAAILQLLLGVVGQVKAELVCSIPGGTVVPIPASNYFGPGPQTVASGITWTSTNNHAVLGFTGSYGFVANGSWDGTLGPMAGVNDLTDMMTFAFCTPVAAVGGFLNYEPGGGASTTIAVYNSDHMQLESYDLTFQTNSALNSGCFLGFEESTANIGFFTLTHNYIGVTNLTISQSPVVPEPSRVAGLLGLASMGIIGLVRRRRRSAA